MGNNRCVEADQGTCWLSQPLAVVAALAVACLALRGAVRLVDARLSDAIDEWSPGFGENLAPQGSYELTEEGGGDDTTGVGRDSRDAMALPMRPLDREPLSDVDGHDAGARPHPATWLPGVAMLCRLAWMSVRIVVAFCQVRLTRNVGTVPTPVH